MQPIRVQRKRSKGFKLPPNTVCVTRGTKHGNPFKIGDRSPNNLNVIIDAQHAVDLFDQLLESKKEAGIYDEFIKPLIGKNIACFCKIGNPCHGDSLLKAAKKLIV